MNTMNQLSSPAEMHMSNPLLSFDERLPCLDEVMLDRRRTSDCLQQLKEPISKKRRLLKRSVRFSENVIVIARDVTQSELRKTWYEEVEYERFREDGRSTISAFSKARGNIEWFNPDKFCIRGFENHISRQQTALRKQRQQRIIQLILNQQSLQRMMGINDQNSLKVISMLFSKESRDRALFRGLSHIRTNSIN